MTYRPTLMSQAILFIESMDDFDDVQNRHIECVKFVCRDPVLFMRPAADGLSFVSSKMLHRYLEPGHVSDFSAPGVPVPRDLDRISLIRDGIENRLFWQPRWKRAKARRLNQRQFRRPNGAIKNNYRTHP